jgi:hypothetical protein
VIDRTPGVTIAGSDGVEVRVPPLRVQLPITVRHGRSDVGAQADASTLSWTLRGLPDGDAPVEVGRLVRLAIHETEGSPTYVDVWSDVWSDVWGTAVAGGEPPLVSTRFVGQITDLETSREDDVFVTSVTAAGVMSAWAAGDVAGVGVPGSRGVPDLPGGSQSPDLERFLPEQTEAERTRLAVASRNVCPDPTLTDEGTWSDWSDLSLPPDRIDDPWQDPSDPCCGKRNAKRAGITVAVGAPAGGAVFPVTDHAQAGIW